MVEKYNPLEKLHAYLVLLNFNSAYLILTLITQ